MRETFRHKHFVESDVPADLVDFICRSLDFDQERRYSIAQLRSHRSHNVALNN